MKIYDDISVIKGVGPKIKENLNKCLIFNVMDLILYFPRDYEAINSTADGKSLVSCNVIRIERDIRTKTSKLLSTVVFDNEGKRLKGKWFNQPYIKNHFIVGEEYKLLGKIQNYKGEDTIINPSIVSSNALYVKAENKEAIIPVYPLKSGVTNTLIMKLLKEVLNSISISENMPEWILEKYDLFSLEDAINSIHFPKDFLNLKMAKDRLKFQELFTFSLKILALKEFHKVNKEGISFKISKVLTTVEENLNYELTGAQRKVLREILNDERKAVPMNRLLQGDVGSGKTIVALISILNVIKNGYQAVLMAPTEILANQHYSEAIDFLGKFGIQSELLCGSITSKNKELVKSSIKSGNIDLVIGTHALLEDDVKFQNLGLVVTDEQHRFGVMQRSKLINKDKCVDTLVMTATPIPRTLSLLLYGDLSLSIIDELPPGRKKTDTYVFNDSGRKKVYEFTCKEIKSGRQAYIVCPLIEENENLNLNSVQALYGKLKKEYFKDVEIRILHGKMNAKAKDEIMRDFKLNKVKIIISTTVIEVGINVPNATIMIIEDADRFGLAQLHQLRGRVGRGQEKSYCMLISISKNQTVKKRLDILRKSNDGFFIAEEDLKLRGSGEIFGFKQHGENGLILADLIEDIDILRKAQGEALKLFESPKDSDKKIKEEFINKIEKNSKFICFN
jgi:ATP-dependent DNA helicase RecG